MSKSVKLRKIITASVNLLLAVFEVIGIVLMNELYLSYGFKPWTWLWYYTQLSNIYSMFVALLIAFFEIKNLLRNTDNTPKALRIIKFSVVCCLTETMLITMFVLAPLGMMGGFVPLMFHGPNLYHHFMCPLIALLSFVFLEKGAKITIKHTVLSMIPTLIYGAVAVTLNILRIWHGPYPFLYVYEQPLYMSLIYAVITLGGAYLISLLVRMLANLPSKITKENQNG